MNNETNVLELLAYEGYTLAHAKNNVMTYFKYRNEKNYRDETKNYLRLYKALKQFEGVELNGEKLQFEYIGENFVTDSVRMANSIINLHSDYDFEGLSTHSVANERAFISQTYKVTFSKVPNYMKFVQSLLSSIKNSGCKKFPVVTFEEFSNKQMSNGQKIGRYLSRCGIDNSFIGNLDHLLQCDDTIKYFTISGATQHIIGMSYFLNGESSCQNWEGNSDVGYALHSLAGSQTKEQFVSFLHDDLEDLDHDINQEIMLSRSTVLRAVENGVPVFYHGKLYGQSQYKQLHKQVIESLAGHFNSYQVYNEGGGTRFEYRLDGGNYINISNKDIYEMTIENEHGTSFSVCCPMCDGDGYINSDVHYHGNYVGRVSHECPLCEGSGEHELELSYDFDGDNASDLVDESELEDLCDNENVFKFYNAHAFEGFSDNGTSVGVYAIKSDVLSYVRSERVKDGKSYLLDSERVNVLNGLISYKTLAGVESVQELEQLTTMQLLEKFVSVYGLLKLAENKDLFTYYQENK